jgi:hypothetical protein
MMPITCSARWEWNCRDWTGHVQAHCCRFRADFWFVAGGGYCVCGSNSSGPDADDHDDGPPLQAVPVPDVAEAKDPGLSKNFRVKETVPSVSAVKDLADANAVSEKASNAAKLRTRTMCLLRRNRLMTLQ